jgi:hypothetical protein
MLSNPAMQNMLSGVMGGLNANGGACVVRPLLCSSVSGAPDLGGLFSQLCVACTYPPHCDIVQLQRHVAEP